MVNLPGQDLGLIILLSLKAQDFFFFLRVEKRSFHGKQRNVLKNQFEMLYLEEMTVKLKLG